MKLVRYGAFLIPLALTLALLACGSTARSAAPTAPTAPQATAVALADTPQQMPVVNAAVEPGLTPSRAVGTTAAPSVDRTNPAPGSRPASDAVSAPTSDALDPHAVVAAYEDVLTGIYESVLPSVVQIQVRTNVPTGERFGGSVRPTASEGSGFVWSSEGYIVTNHHVIDGADNVMVIFADGLELEATVLGSDPDSDLAALKVDPPAGGLRPVGLGDSDQLRVGQLALALGSPFGQEFSMTSGIVSALGRVLQAGESNFSNPEIIQTDGPINPGNSGGPLIDRHGNVVGINSQIISRSGGSSGVGFAVPINTAKRIVPVLIEEGDYIYAYLGISGSSLGAALAKANDLPSDTRGVLVVTVVPGGPADRAGLSEARGTATVDGIDYPTDGQIITAIDGTPIDGMDDLVAYMAERNRPGDTVTFDVIAGGRVSQVRVTLGARPEVVS